MSGAALVAAFSTGIAAVIYVSAAIVVFLAAYAGIAIVSQTSSDPNPYVVFVTCLVGAVFGDNVWLWAKDKFLPKGNGSTATPNPSPSGRGTTAPASGAGETPPIEGGSAPVGSGGVSPGGGSSVTSGPAPPAAGP